MEAWIKGLNLPKPKLHTREADIVFTASIYEHLEGDKGWKDFLGRVKAVREQLVNDLVKGKFSHNRPNVLTDDDVRAMLFIVDRLLDIPAGAKAEFEAWKQRQDSQVKVQGRIESTLGED